MDRCSRRTLVMVLGVVLMAGGCAPSSPQGLVLADADQLAMLTGTWKGSFLNAATSRTGSIEFTLTAYSEFAYGDVRMHVAEKEHIYQPMDGQQQVSRGSTRPLVLKISFLRLSNGIVRGVLEPYEDPECRCLVVTTFEGTMRKGVIEGTFYTRGAGMRPIPTGSWNVIQVNNR